MMCSRFSEFWNELISELTIKLSAVTYVSTDFLLLPVVFSVVDLMDFKVNSAVPCIISEAECLWLLE